MPSALIGRAHEQEVLRSALERAAAGTGGLVVLSGEAGVGKTRLLTEVGELARPRTIPVLIGHCRPGGPPYRPVAEALLPAVRRGELSDSPALRPFRAVLARLLPGWGPAAAPEPSLDPVLALGEGVIRLLLELGAAAVVLAVEDLHWADPDTVALLQYLADAAATAPTLLLGTTRDWPRPPGLDTLTRGLGVSRIDLGPLTPAEVNELIDTVVHRPLSVEQRELVHRRSQGLPFLVEELAAGAIGDGTVPPTFAALVQSRLAELPPGARRLMIAAAAFGERPDWDLVPPLAQVDPATAMAELRRAVGAQLVASDAGSLRWRHSLTREAIWATVLAPERRLLAGQAADLLLARGSRADADAAFERLLEAGDTQRAAAVLSRLVSRDLATGALRNAERLLAVGRELESAVPELAVLDIELRTLRGRPREALDRGADALAAVRGQDHAELCLQLARTAISAREWDLAEQYLDRAGRPNDVRSLILAADAAHGAGHIEGAEALATAAVEAADSAAPPAVVCEALCVAGRLARLRDHEEAAELFGRAAQVASEHGLLPWRVEALLGVGTVELQQEERSPAIAQARALAEELGLVWKAASIDVVASETDLLTGGPGAVAAKAAAMVERGRRLGVPMLTAIGLLFQATYDAVTGDLGALEAKLAHIAPDPSLPFDLRAQTAGVRGLARLVDHDLTGAAGLLEEGLRPLLVPGPAPPLYHFGLWVVVRTAANPADAEPRQTLRRLPVGQRRGTQGGLAYADAMAAGWAGEHDRAAAAYDDGQRLLAPLPWWQRVLRLPTLERGLLDGWMDPVPQLRSDLAAFEATEDEHLARLTRDLLRRSGVPTRRGRGDSVVPPALRARGITSRELDVLRLVAGGRSNAEVAGQLFLSTRTVETHVTNLLAKVGAANRAELRAWYDRQPR